MTTKPPLLQQYNSKRFQILKLAGQVGIAQAKLLVRKDTAELTNSIEEKISTKNYIEYGSNKAYAKAQEYGLTRYGKPKYGYTPYLRPSALKVVQKLPLIFRKVW